MRRFLLLSVAAASGLCSCAKPPVVRPAPATMFVVLPGREVSTSSTEMLEGMLTDYGFVTVNRVLVKAIFEGLQIPASGPLEPALAAEIYRRSRAQVMIALNLRKNDKELAYVNGAYNLQMRWISLPDGNILVSRTKALYFMPRPNDIKDLMKGCLEAYRADHPAVR
jgi:hypothetical protein